MSQGTRKIPLGRFRDVCPKNLAKFVLSDGLPPALETFELRRLRSAKKDSSLREVVHSRKSRYEAKRDMTRDEFTSFLLDWITPGESRWNGLDERKRRYPSGGGLYESMIFLLIQRLDRFPSGLYVFDIEKRELRFQTPIREVSPDIVLFPYAAARVKFKNPLPQVQIFIAADLKRLTWAYRNLPYRLALTNASVLMAQGLLWAESYGLAAYAMGICPSNLLAESMNIDEREYPVLAQFCVVGSIGRKFKFSSSSKASKTRRKPR